MTDLEGPQEDGFSGEDPRGITVCAQTGVFDGICIKHPELRGRWSIMTSALRNPDYIMDNKEDPYGPPRVAGERYVKFIPHLERKIVIPVRTSSEGERLHGIGTVPAGSRIAVSGWLTTGTPRGKIIWARST